MIKFLRLFLFPFAIIYGFIILLRNKLYDWGIFKSTKFDLPVICIGNLVVGGAGKTPTTEYLVRLLADDKVAILSRGYGRKTKGFLLADENATAETIGDEPMQYYQKFKNVTVAVCEDRVLGINKLKDTHDVILLDDAYQHRAVKAGFNLLLFDYASVQKSQFLLPMGNLREPWRNYDRAEAVLVTKAPLPLNMVDQIKVRKRIDTRIDQRISFSNISYGQLVNLNSKEIKQEIILLYNGGLGLVSISKSINMGPEKIKQILLENNIELRKRGGQSGSNNGMYGVKRENNAHFTGKKHKENSREKISNTLKLLDRGKHIKINNIEYVSIREATKYTNIPASTISRNIGKTIIRNNISYKIEINDDIK